MLETIGKVKRWAHERNLIEGSNSASQYLKLVSELGELADNINKKQDVRDSIGDCLVVLLILGEQNYVSTSRYIKCFADIVHGDVAYRGEQSPKVHFMWLADAVGRIGRQLSRDRCIGDQIMDCVLRLSDIADLSGGYTLAHCLEHAYNEIKDRRGVMLDGVFIKEDDTAYEAAVELLGKD